MKRKFEIVNRFLKGYGADSIGFSWNWYEYDTNEPEWQYTWTSFNSEKRINIPENIIDLVIEIVKDYWKETLEYKSSTESYKIDLTIYPKESRWVINGSYEDIINQPESYNNDIRDEEFNQYLDDTDIEFVEVEYDGSSDSGWITSIDVDGKSVSATYGQRDVKYEPLINKLYEILENIVSGWEIDDGSEGRVEIIKKRDQEAQISLEHSWNVREYFDSGREVVLTKDTFSDEE
jgi:hypothetical protein